MADPVSDDELRAEILRIAERRGGGKTLCPSDAARSIGGDDWRDLMPAARRIAFELAGDGLVDVTQKGERVQPGVRGPIRIRWIDRPDAAVAPVPEAPGLASVPYAYTATVAPSSTLVFCAGACPLTPTGEVGGVDLPEQADLCLQNLVAALASSGATLSDVVQVRIYVATTDRADVLAVWDRLAAAWGDQAPPSTLLGVTVLGYPGQLVELEAVAAVPRGGASG